MTHPKTVFRAGALRHALLISCLMPALAALAQGQASTPGWQAGAVLDVSATSRGLALGKRDQGLGLGHSDVSATGPLGRHLDARLTAAFHTDDPHLEGEVEEAWVQTRQLPAGLQLRAGRFSSQIGYLNEQHPHADDFVERPLLYRAFFGGHWFDDGLRLNWTAPTEQYLRLGAEVFRGRGLVKDASAASRPGAVTLSARTGGDIGRSQGWQAGLSLLHNRREAAVEEHEEGEGGSHEAHGAAYSGARVWLADVAWKWAPEGNNRREQVRVAYEHAVITRINRFATRSDKHHAGYLAAVWRFAPAWEAGVRADVLRVRPPHEDGFDDGRLRERALMLAYKPTHTQTVRLQVTRQQDRGGFADANHAVQVQYILNLGAHAAHAF